MNTGKFSTVGYRMTIHRVGIYDHGHLGAYILSRTQFIYQQMTNGSMHDIYSVFI